MRVIPQRTIIQGNARLATLLVDGQGQGLIIMVSLIVNLVTLVLHLRTIMPVNARIATQPMVGQEQPLTMVD